VVYGFKHGARVVTAAALIMISVFAAFMFMDLQLIKVMGFALATAVLFDAFIVRMTIIPATMFLLDARAWSIPRWLGRLLPNVDIEGEKLTSGLT
jgi:drug exporter of the RND family protein